MITKKRKIEIQKSLNTLNKNDIYSMLLFTLYKMRELPEYSTLSELSYVLDNDNLVKLISYFGGTTIRIPTLREMRLLTESLVLYEYVNLNGGQLAEGLAVICKSEFKQDEILEVYTKICEVVKNFDFERLATTNAK